MSSFYSRSELARFKKYKRHYVSEGFPADVATQYSWDFIWASRKAKSNSPYGFKVVR